MTKYRYSGVGEGPLLLEQDDMSPPLLRCWYNKENRCIHLGIHDYHYFYCAAQNSLSNYPWEGAGKQLRHPTPDKGCPFLKEKDK